jgi:hypothetical protein
MQRANSRRERHITPPIRVLNHGSHEKEVASIILLEERNKTKFTSW